MTNQFVAGIVGAPFGLKGFVKVKSLSGETAHLLRLKSATLRRDGREWIAGIAESSAAPPALIMRFEGFDSPEAAKALSGAELLVGRDGAAPLRPGEFYVEDLKGLAVTLPGPDAGGGANGAVGEGEVIGHIASVIEGGGGDLAEIRLLGGETRLVPFRPEFFPVVDIEGGRAALAHAWVLE